MKKYKMIKTYLTTYFLIISSWLLAQDSKINLLPFDGVVVLGYVNQGGYLNFAGPSITANLNDSKVMLSMLPSLRFKEDQGTTKNAFVTPTLGIGLTYSYRAFAFQVPLYYNSKTSTQDGQWNIGVGVGLRWNQLKKKKKM
jgi:hypothetical protein